MSLRDAIERWRADFRQGVEDAHALWQEGPAVAASFLPPQSDYSEWLASTLGSAPVWGVAPGPTPQGGQATHDPLFEHLVALCEEQEARITALTRDREQSSAEVNALRGHCEAIRKIGWQAMLKAAHPDSAPPEQRAARDELFKLVKTIFGRN